MTSILGWDIGAANVKAACLDLEEIEFSPAKTIVQPFEIWHGKERLPEVLRSVHQSLSANLPRAMAVTMTAELSDAFVNKREGVLFVLDSLAAAFPGRELYVFSLSGAFVPLDSAKTRPLEFAASNWLASAQWIAREQPDCLLIDVGSSTTDIIPIVDGRVTAVGRTDMERLSSGELVYTGALRTNLAAIVQSVPVAGGDCRVASEYFAVSGDVHLILGNIAVGDYTCSTPDGRSPSIESARARLARLVCADTEMLASSEIDSVARYVCERQIRQICAGIDQVLSRRLPLRRRHAIVLGSGSFLGLAAAREAGLETQEAGTAAGPCVAVASLLAGHLRKETR